MLRGSRKRISGTKIYVKSVREGNNLDPEMCSWGSEKGFLGQRNMLS